ncbi:uncharacterized protein [Magallana gigas]|uniref:uncharacterized protein isoform X5 n=1 Tax=Magallana gigas TaxID=29159 RepID=UPI003342D30F
MCKIWRRIGAFCLHPRIIFISDGRPTSFTNLASAFVEDSPLDETENDTDHLLQLTRSIGKISPIFCIPVGRNPDMTTLEFISGQSRGGKIVCASEARQFAKYSLNIRTASMLSFTMENDCNDNERILTSLACKFPDKIFTEMDQKDIIDICLRKYLYQSVSSMEDEIEDKMESPHEEKYPQMPRLGSRVRRGRDWRYDDHDNYGPGTIVSHLKEGTLLVEWDNGIKSDYRFGTKSKCNNKYDVQLCSEPRILVNELIATGCLVTRGKDWIWGSQDGGAGNIGSVISVHSSGVVFVRWQHGLISNYKFGADGCFDLEISDPFSPEAIKFLQDHVKKTPFDSRDGAQVDVDESNNCTDGNSSSTINSLSEKNSESVKTSSFDSVNRPILHVTKGKYFKNNSVVENATPDIETDGPTFTCAINQWWWKDCEGKWSPYSREVNERINKCYKRDPKSTVIVAIKDQSYRVVMAKNQQINQTTRDISEIKLVTNWSCP